jgi:oxygen-independent coproporphyrinogen-3 oxidase
LPLDESGLVRQFKALLDLTEKQKFIHYEISNFAREGFYSKHNSLYWTGGHYLGLGPSAHSYNGHSRRWNQASIKSWLDLKEHYSESFEEEILSPDQRYNEYVMTSLRTIWGCNSETIRQEFGIEYADHLLREAQQFLKERKLEMKGNRIFLTNKGKLFADGISSALFK